MITALRNTPLIWRRAPLAVIIIGLFVRGYQLEMIPLPILALITLVHLLELAFMVVPPLRRNFPFDLYEKWQIKWSSILAVVYALTCIFPNFLLWTDVIGYIRGFVTGPMLVLQVYALFCFSKKMYR